MKAFWFWGALLFLIVGQLQGLGLKPSIGVEGGLSFSELSWERSDSWDKDRRSLSQFRVPLGVDLDLVYVELTAGLDFQIGDSTWSYRISDPYGNFASADPVQLATKQVDFVARGLIKWPIAYKTSYPFKRGESIAYPVVGLEYDRKIMLNVDYLALDDEYNDLLLNLGGGWEGSLGENGYIRVLVLYDVNLTPSSSAVQSSASLNGLAYQDYGYRLAVLSSAGIRF